MSKWTTDDLPSELAHLPDDVATKAVELANELHAAKPKRDDQAVLTQAIADASRWKETRDRELMLRSDSERPVLHVMRQLGEWTVIREGEKRGEETYGENRDEAITQGRAKARKLGADLVLHDRHGGIEGREIHRREKAEQVDAVFHVFDHPDGWTIQSSDPNAERPVFDTKKEAVKHAKKLAREQKGELIVHKQDGSVSKQYSYEAE